MASKAHWGYSAAQLESWHGELAMTPERIGAESVWVIEADARVAGFYSLKRQGAGWHLDDLWLLGPYMGRGMGRALLRHALQHAAAQGAGSVTVDADPNALAFYLACGAEVVGSVPAPIAGQPQRARPQLVLRIGCEAPVRGAANGETPSP